MMEMKQVQFDEVSADKFGVVMMGCVIDTDEQRQGFIRGMTDLLVRESVLPEGTTPSDAWESVSYLTSTGGRHDVLYVARPGALFNMGRFTTVRLGVRDLKWVSDWKEFALPHYVPILHALRGGEDCDTVY